MKAVSSLAAVLAIVGLSYAGGQIAGLRPVFGAAVPYAAIAIFLIGFSWRVVRWTLTPVPFRIPTSCGQQRSLVWIKRARLENPATALGVIGRMALEVLLFRSLFRNTRAELRQGPRLVYGEEKWLWLGALAFHWSFLIIFLRHLRFFLEPVPGLVVLIQDVDGFLQVGTPVLYLTGAVILAALSYLLWRRLASPQLRYVSLFTDYFALFLLLGIVVSGLLMRYFTRTDVVAIKQYALGLMAGAPVLPAAVTALFFVHLGMVSALLAYFPFSKLMHMPGVFLSPTRNLANNNRMKRHVNPWDYPVKVHTYQEWEEEFLDKIVAAGLPLDKES
jgi:nitrate reductase gamma subunit